jgi:hypothetical protein
MSPLHPRPGFFQKSPFSRKLHVKKKLVSLKENKSSGPDALPPKVLKEVAAQLSGPLS